MEERKMFAERDSQIVHIISLLVIICLLGVPAFAKYGGGTGEPNYPYQITAAADLIALGEAPEDYDKYFILTTDIDLDPNLPGCKVFDKAVIAPDANDVKDFQGVAFTGSFDGDRHKITHLAIDGGNRGFLGLFGKIGAGGAVRDLRLEDALIKGANGSKHLGGLAGYAEDCSIINCSSSGLIRAGLNASSLGGIAGFVWFGGRITQCSSSCNISAGDNSEDLGGMVGANGGEITNCYASGSISAGNGCKRLGGLVGFNEAIIYYPGSTWHSRGLIFQCYSTGKVSTGSQNTSLGGLVGQAGESYIGSSFWDIETSGISTSAGGVGLTSAEMQNLNTFASAGWDLVGERANGTSDLWLMPEGGGYPLLTVLSETFQARQLDGSGTADDPYRIATPEDLGAICHYNHSACYQLTHDVNLAGITWTTAPVAHFDGTLDGAGFIISNLTIQGPSSVGLFCALDTNAHVKNLRIGTAVIAGGNSVGILAAQNRGLITDCSADGDITGNDAAGGLVGYNREHGIISGCYTIGSVSKGNTTYYIGGGLVGLNIGTITRSHAQTEVAGTGDLGGLVGSNSGRIDACYVRGRVAGEDCRGGLVGYNSKGTITNSYATVDIYATGFNIEMGSLVGATYAGTIAKCYTVGTIFANGESWTHGGLIGSTFNIPSTVVDCFWDEEVSGIHFSYGGTGKTTAEMQTARTFLEAGWDFVGETANGTDDIWWILEGKDYPRLWWEANNN